MIELLVAADDSKNPPMLTRLTSMKNDMGMVITYFREWNERYPKRKITINFTPDKEPS
jgi:hypothetical protein